MALNPNTEAIDMDEVDLTLCDRGDHDGCRICYEVDNLVCDRGRHCAGLRIGDLPQPIGYFMDGDDRGTSAYTFRFADNDEFLFCEDCAYDIRENGLEGVTDPIVSGSVEEFDWFVDVADGKFQAHVAEHGPDHGAVWERDGGVFDTLTDALDGSRGWARLFVAERDEAMAIDEARLACDVSRSKHPTDLAVPTTLTVEELDFVIGFYTDDDPTTVRSMLSDACRQVVGEMIADLAESGKIPASTV